MARVTVEDCLHELDNRFDLVLVASKRARQLATGGKDAYLEWENDKPTVMALREIAEGHIGRSILTAKPGMDSAEEPSPAPVAEATTGEAPIIAAATPTTEASPAPQLGDTPKPPSFL